MSVTEIPFRLAGCVLGSAMPFSDYDPDGDLFDLYRDLNVTAVVLLCSREEMLAAAGRDLPTLYAAEGMRVISLPIPDYGVPDQAALETAVDEALAHVRAGGNLAIHCHGGVGRTGMFAACMAKRVLGIGGAQAIDWVRRYIPAAVETGAQRQLVMEFGRQGC